MSAFKLLLLLLALGIDILQGTLNPRKCPATNSGCIYDDLVEGTDCLAGGNLACKAAGADYCSAVFGTPARHVCCLIAGAEKTRAHIDIRGCPPSNQGCIFDDKVQGADCTARSNLDCFATGADYCGAWHGYPPRRVCCSIVNLEPKTLTVAEEHACPDSNSGCIFDDYVNGVQCTEGGNEACLRFGSDYCSAQVGLNQSRRVCCDISNDLPLGPADTDASKVCPGSNEGCIFDDKPDRMSCTVSGNAACKQAGSDYCGAFHSDKTYAGIMHRQCCEIFRGTGTQEAFAAYKRTCPASRMGCIYDDHIDHTDCTIGGTQTCHAAGSDYCSAVVGQPERRVCCHISGKSLYQKSNPDIRGCPPSNHGCIFDDIVQGADCTQLGNKACFQVGADYCSARYGEPQRRTCCMISRDNKKQTYTGVYAETCPVSNMGCIFDHYVDGTDCTVGGNVDCLTNGSDYCSSSIGEPPRRVCCSIAGPGPAPHDGDGAHACPGSNSGCIYDDFPMSTADCTRTGNEACISAGADYCSAFSGQPPRRVCCLITGRESSKLKLYFGLFVIAALTVLVVISTVFVFCHRRAKRKMRAKMWCISVKDLEKYYEDENATAKTSLASKRISMSSLERKNSEETMQTKATTVQSELDIHIYKGSMVVVKKHENCTHIKKCDITEMIHMKELNHENINSFIGLCVDAGDGETQSVWNLCVKGSLMDLLTRDTRFKLDRIFKYSFINDLVQGMNYLAKSWLKKHGRLTSECCLINSLWQLKIGDYGLSNISNDNNIHSTEQLWEAPELLEGGCSTSIQTDIYSMGIIMSEILNNAPAWSANDEDVEVILYRVRKREKPPYRPVIEADHLASQKIIQLMKNCWEQVPYDRPEMRTMLQTLKSLRKLRTTSLMDHVMLMMDKNRAALEAENNVQTELLAYEREKNQTALYQMLPKFVSDKLSCGQVVAPELFEQVTIMCFCVSSFDRIASKLTPSAALDWLNDIFSVCDSVIDRFQVYKVDHNISHEYLCMSGVPVRNANEQAWLRWH